MVKERWVAEITKFFVDCNMVLVKTGLVARVAGVTSVAGVTRITRVKAMMIY